jgi:hypothetical protein
VHSWSCILDAVKQTLNKKVLLVKTCFNRIFPISSLSFFSLPWFVIFALNYASISLIFLKTNCFEIPFFHQNLAVNTCSFVCNLHSIHQICVLIIRMFDNLNKLSDNKFFKWINEVDPDISQAKLLFKYSCLYRVNVSVEVIFLEIPFLFLGRSSHPTPFPELYYRLVKTCFNRIFPISSLSFFSLPWFVIFTLNYASISLKKSLHSPVSNLCPLIPSSSRHGHYIVLLSNKWWVNISGEWL